MNRRSFLGGLAALIAVPAVFWSKREKAKPEARHARVAFGPTVIYDDWRSGAPSLKRGDRVAFSGQYDDIGTISPEWQGYFEREHRRIESESRIQVARINAMAKAVSR